MHNHQPKHYTNLVIMAVLSFIAMYVLMYAMVDSFTNVYININQFYMAGLMTSSMVIMDLVIMNFMYKNKLMNVLVIGAGTILLIAFFMLIRKQTMVSDTQFLKSMIPHHAGAILMCRNAPLQDAEIKQLCNGILASQQSEMDWMKTKLDNLN